MSKDKTTTTIIGDYVVKEDKYRGWYRLFTIYKKDGDTLYSSRLLRDKPTYDDYKRFIEWVERGE